MDFDTIKQGIFSFTGQLILYGGGTVAIAYAAFVFFGKKWIENKFAKNLEEFKKEQDIEINKFQLKIDSLLNRVTKLHDKEFEVLPRVWKKLIYTHSAILKSIYGGSESPSALSHIEAAHEIFLDFHRYFSENCIFLNPDLEEKIKELDELLLNLLITNKMSRQWGNPKKVLEKLDNNDPIIKEKIREIEMMVQTRLRPQETIA